jgi:dihydrofolate reductase
MRKIITTTFVTLDGVMQAPGGSEEDTSGGFKYGGWQAAVSFDEMLNSTISGFMSMPFELLLGRTTYEIWAAYWPHTKTAPEIANPFNSTKKYVVSGELFEPSWHNSICITGDVVEQIKKIKQEDGPDLWVWGSGNLIQTLLKHRLIDRMHLWIYPLTIGSGKRLFADGTIAEKFKLIESKISSTGVIVATYEPIGDFKTGRMDK